jgi:ABC-type uncharacterized transport system permease subunit
MSEAARVELTDVLIAAVVSVSGYALAPIYYDLIGRIVSSADPLSELLLQLVVPFVFVGIIISIGVSARRRAA